MSETEQTEFDVSMEAEVTATKKTAKKKTARKAAKKAATKKTVTKKAARKRATTAEAEDFVPQADALEVPAVEPQPQAARVAEPVGKEELPESKGGVYSFDPDDEPEYPGYDSEDRREDTNYGERSDDERQQPQLDDELGAAASDPRDRSDRGQQHGHQKQGGHQQNRNQGGGKQHNKGGKQDFGHQGKNKKFDRNQGNKNQQNQHPNQNQQNQQQQQGKKQKQKQKQRHEHKKKQRFGQSPDDTSNPFNVGELLNDDIFLNDEELNALAAENAESGADPVLLNPFLEKTLKELSEAAHAIGVKWSGPSVRHNIIDAVIEHYYNERVAVVVEGVIEMTEDEYGIVTYAHDNYRIKAQGAFVHPHMVEKYGLKRGHKVRAQIHPKDPDGSETCPAVIKLLEVMEAEAGEEPYEVDPFNELTAYYPLERILLETSNDNKWDNLSMRVVDLLTPIGLGQRGLIVAPPRTGKTVLLQGIANSIMVNKPEAHLIVLLIDERPEEVTDFKRQIHHGEVISSTFDEDAESHVHCAEMVIEKSRRMVEAGRDVIILLDSITRLARAYNTMLPSSGKILSGGVEANALQKPKRFFGSARNIENEGGGSLTILATALVDTGSRMDEVIFEEFKGTGNMEIHLDRALVDKRIFPAINLEKSGTRKEELLYHPEEMAKIYSLRRAMKGVPSTEAMEMLISRVKKTRTNAEFLMALNR